MCVGVGVGIGVGIGIGIGLISKLMCLVGEIG